MIMNNESKNKNPFIQLGWIVMPEDIDNPDGNIDYYGLYMRTDKWVRYPSNNVQQSESTETKRMSFGEKLKWVFSNK